MSLFVSIAVTVNDIVAVEEDMMYPIIEQELDKAMLAMFPHGAGRASDIQVRHWLEQIAQVAYREGKHGALLGLMTAEEVAEHFQITPRRARALIKNRHRRFGVGMKAGNTWLVHQDELAQLQPDKKHRRLD